MTLAIRTVITNIARLNISGVTVRDVDAIKEGLTDRDCPCLFPNPAGFVTDLQITPQAYGAAGDRPYNASYTLNYRLCDSAVGSGRGLFDQYPDLVTHAYAVIDALIAADDLAGSVEFQVNGISGFGPVADPAGKLFHGCDISVTVTEFVNN